MPGPTTEVFNEDIKELKTETREIRSHLERLGGEIHRIDIGLAELRAEFRFAKWLLGLLLAMTVSGFGAGVWWAATITNEVRHLGQFIAIPKAPPAAGPIPNPRAN